MQIRTTDVSPESSILIDSEDRDGHIEGVLRFADGRKQNSIVMIQTHPRDWSCLWKWPGDAFIGSRVDTFSFNNRYSNSMAGTELMTHFELIAYDIALGVRTMREYGYSTVLLYGHSAGGPAVAFLQALARGLRPLGTPGVSRAFHEANWSEAAADGLVLSGPTLGTGATFLLRLDPAIDDALGQRDESIDMYSPANGYDPATGLATYTAEFLTRYRTAQARRMDRLRAQAESLLVAGDGLQENQSVMHVRGTRADPAVSDLQLESETDGAYVCIERDGTAAFGPVCCERKPRANEHERNQAVPGMAVHTPSSFLSYRSVGTLTQDELVGTAGLASHADYASVNSSTIPSLQFIDEPVLIVQGTADDEVRMRSAEAIRANCRNSASDLVFIRGADHYMRPVDDAAGDTKARGADAIRTWIERHFDERGRAS